MILKPTTKDALDAWIGPSTWATRDDRDMNRFYDFVSQYQKDHGYTIDESGLLEIIEQKLGGEPSTEEQETIRERISLAYNILDFLKHTGR